MKVKNYQRELMNWVINYEKCNESEDIQLKII